jgi:hypothetical protein
MTGHAGISACPFRLSAVIGVNWIPKGPGSGSIILLGKGADIMLGRSFYQYVKLLAGFSATVFLLLATVCSKGSYQPRQLIFNISRLLSYENTNILTSHLLQTDTKHFIIRYQSKDKKDVSMIASTAEQIYGPVTELFGYQPPRATMVVVYPDSQSLAKSFGWDKDQQAMGVYWGGTIRILNPDAWITGSDKRTTFIKEGPMAHEFAHLLVDYRTKGNYPRWFTEGMAQYAEKKITGFEFSDPFQYGATVSYYDMNTLENNFDNLDQSIAYWQCLKMTEYMIDKYGEDKVFGIMDYLGQGDSMARAFKASTGQTFSEFEQEVYSYLTTNP